MVHLEHGVVLVEEAAVHGGVQVFHQVLHERLHQCQGVLGAACRRCEGNIFMRTLNEKNTINERYLLLLVYHST